MPFSTGVGKEFFALNFAGNPDIVSVVDVGAGAGQYCGYRRDHQHWVALEVWAPYVGVYGLDKKYNRVIVGDIRYIDGTKALYRPDLMIFGDILEHLTFDDLTSVIKDAVARDQWAARNIYISSPIGHVPQGAWCGNSYESHLHDFDPDAVTSLLEQYGEVKTHIDYGDPVHAMYCAWLTVK